MARLPAVGGDYGNWGTVLNEYLETSHNADGTLKLDVQTIADLKAIDVTTLTDKQQALVAGYYAPGDQGGGVFYYDAAASDADNGGTTIAPNAGAGRWWRVYSGVVNVKWFGASETGDAGPALMAAIAASSTLYVPRGTYTVSTWTTPTVSSLLRISGEGDVVGLPDKDFANADGGVIVSGIKLTAWNRAFELSAATSLITADFSGVTFDSISTCIRWVPASWATTKGLERLVIESCRGVSLQGTFAHVLGRFDSVVAMRNHFTNCVDRIFDFGTDDDARYQYFGDVTIAHNTLDGLTTSGANSVCMIKCNSKEPRIIGNVMRNIVGSAGTENWGIYIKSRNAVVNDNAVIGLSNDGANEGGGLFAIDIKGIPHGITTTGADLTKGYGSEVSGNHVVLNGLGTCLRMYCADASVHDNRVEGGKIGINVSPTVPTFRLSVHNNRCFAGAAAWTTGSVGIQLPILGDDVRAHDNQVTGYRTGVEAIAQARGCDYLDVSRNTIDASVYGIAISFGSASAYFRRLSVNNNVIRGDAATLTHCIRISGAVGSAVYALQCLDNDAEPYYERFSSTKALELHAEGVKSAHIRWANFPYQTADEATTHTIASIEFPEMSRGDVIARAFGFKDATDHISAVRHEAYSNTGTVTVLDTAESGDPATAYLQNQASVGFGTDAVWLNQTGDVVNVKVIGIAASTVKWNVGFEAHIGGEDNPPADVVRGTASASTDSSGVLTIAHGLGRTPIAANAWIVGYKAPRAEITAIDGTNVTITAYDATGVVVPSSGPYAIVWEAR